MRNIKIVVGEDEEKILPFVWINGKQSEVFYDVELVGQGASVTLVGVFLGSSNNTVNFNTRITHKAPNTKSLTTLRGVFLERSSINNDGLITIKKGAKGADGYFASKILLFDDAKGRSVPSLEIDENELKAGHASTVGRPDESQLFYLRSRGLSKREAEQLIIAGFFDPVVKLLSLDQQRAIKRQVRNYLKYTTT